MKIQIDKATVEQAIEYIAATNKSSEFWLVPGSKLNQVVTSLQAALTAAPPPAEPVAWLCVGNEIRMKKPLNWRKEGAVPLFTAPQPQREPLTDQQLKEAFGKLYPQDLGLIELAENNRDYALESIGARHHWAAFKAGAKAIESMHGIGVAK